MMNGIKTEVEANFQKWAPIIYRLLGCQVNGWNEQTLISFLGVRSVQRQQFLWWLPCADAKPDHPCFLLRDLNSSLIFTEKPQFWGSIHVTSSRCVSVFSCEWYQWESSRVLSRFLDPCWQDGIGLGLKENIFGSVMLSQHKQKCCIVLCCASLFVFLFPFICFFFQSGWAWATNKKLSVSLNLTQNCLWAHARERRIFRWEVAIPEERRALFVRAHELSIWETCVNDTPTWTLSVSESKSL